MGSTPKFSGNPTRYRGVDVFVDFHPARPYQRMEWDAGSNSYRPVDDPGKPWFTARTVGKGWELGYVHARSEQATFERAARAIDGIYADNEIRAAAQAAYRVASPPAPSRSSKVGDVVRVQARGHKRPGVVESIAKTGTLTVACVTPTSPEMVSRITVKASELAA